MAFISDKWRESSILTKGASFAMALNTLLTLIGNIMLFSVDGSSAGGKIFWFLFTTGVQALLTFGIFKVNRVARVFTILEGLGSVLVVVVMIASWKYVAGSAGAAGAAASGLMGMLIGLVWSIIPAGAKAIIGIFVLPYVLQILSMLLLIIGGKDFAKVKREEL
ncbi:MAG: hypothetical protein LBD37_10895 [Treponema sp.]|jgi:hypothetical protein|nr:hypothetical protein [Treponema sp.]